MSLNDHMILCTFQDVCFPAPREAPAHDKERQPNEQAPLLQTSEWVGVVLKRMRHQSQSVGLEAR